MFFQDDLPCLAELVFTGNPLEETLNNTDKGYRQTVQDKLTKLKKLDGMSIIIIQAFL